MADPLISVVIPTRNRSRMLDALLQSLERQSLDPSRFEVVVIDDGSTDDTPAVLERAQDRVPYRLRVASGDGAGPAAARNKGWPLAAGELVAFTDDDCVATPEWLAALLREAGDDRDVIVQGRTEIAPEDEVPVGPFSRVLEIREPSPYFATCNMLYPRALLHRLGGFDERFAAAGEDTDLAWRARELGTDWTFARDAVVQHAVVQLGPIGKLRWALHWSDAMRVLRAHPSLRKTLTWGIFWKRSHALLALALLGLLLSRRFAPAVLLGLPYARALRARCIVENYSLRYMPYLALYDLIETIAAARGGVRYRVPVL